ncbi:transposase [Streptomyces sp. CNQ-509]|uniref:transposase n=1 Tax=Streptomyces sp. CNQ-509 TaxID=444103 RepID=UPI000AC9A8D7|nr:transposase [Streptomyces sp. CNQ-509]
MVADAGCGVSTPFRLGLEQRGLSCVLALTGKAVAHPEQVRPHRPSYGGPGPPTPQPVGRCPARPDPPGRTAGRTGQNPTKHY